jgi:hypothetical protein
MSHIRFRRDEPERRSRFRREHAIEDGPGPGLSQELYPAGATTSTHDREAHPHQGSKSTLVDDDKVPAALGGRPGSRSGES